MEGHSHSAHEVGAAEDTHGHYVGEISGAVHDDDLQQVKRDLVRLRDRVRDLEAKTTELEAQAQAEHAAVEAIKAGAVTIPALVAALRYRAEHAGSESEYWFTRELERLAVEIEAGR